MTVDFSGHNWVMTRQDSDGNAHFSCRECTATKVEYMMNAKE